MKRTKQEEAFELVEKNVQELISQLLKLCSLESNTHSSKSMLRNKALSSAIVNINESILTFIAIAKIPAE